jgi:hypothetical protein
MYITGLTEKKRRGRKGGNTESHHGDGALQEGNEQRGKGQGSKGVGCRENKNKTKNHQNNAKEKNTIVANRNVKRGAKERIKKIKRK